MIPKLNKRQVIPIHRFEKKALPFDISKLNALTMKSYDSARLPHRHNYYEIFVFYKGGGKHYIDFNTHDIEDCSLHFISPGQVHLIRRAVGCSGYVITFPEELFMAEAGGNVLQQILLYNNQVKSPIVNCNKAQMAHIKQQLQCLIQEENTPDAQSLELIKMHLNIILLNSNRWFIDKKENKGIVAQTAGMGSIVQQFKTLVDANYLTINEVSKYAELLAVSSGYLNDVVKKGTGFTASWHIHNRMLLEAKRLLYHGSHSVKEISFMLNFDDPTYFGRFFKKHTGQTPGDFRISIREKYHK